MKPETGNLRHEIRGALIAAHRAQDWTRAAELSAQAAEFKAAKRHQCRRCSETLSTRARAHISGLCRTCRNFVRYHLNKLNTIQRAQ